MMRGVCQEVFMSLRIRIRCIHVQQQIVTIERQCAINLGAGNSHIWTKWRIKSRFAKHRWLSRKTTIFDSNSTS